MNLNDAKTITHICNTMQQVLTPDAIAQVGNPLEEISNQALVGVFKSKYSKREKQKLAWIRDFGWHVLTVNKWDNDNELAAYNWPNQNNVVDVMDEIMQNMSLTDDAEFTAYDMSPMAKSPVADEWLDAKMVYAALGLDQDMMYLTAKKLQNGNLVVVDLPQCDKNQLDKIREYQWIKVSKELLNDYICQVVDQQSVHTNRYKFVWDRESQRDRKYQEKLVQDYDWE